MILPMMIKPGMMRGVNPISEYDQTEFMRSSIPTSRNNSSVGHHALAGISELPSAMASTFHIEKSLLSIQEFRRPAMIKTG